MFLRPLGASQRLAVQLQSVRTAKRVPAYPRYRAQVVPLSHPKKDHSSYFQRHMKAWLGPRNIRGEYYRNKYYFAPQDNTPNYVVSDGNSVVVPGKETFTRAERNRNPALHPFAQNLHCKTASVVSDELKQQIHSAVSSGVSAQKIAQDHGIKLARVEAIVRLQEIEKKWREQVCVAAPS